MNDSKNTCPHCGEKIYDSILLRKLDCSCVDCEHFETDHGVCLDCGEDQTEWLAMAAYDRAKDAKYD